MFNKIYSILLFIIITINNCFYINKINSKNTYNFNNNIINNCNNKWNYHKNMLYKIKNFNANGYIILKNNNFNIFLNFYINKINSNIKIQAYTKFGIKLIDFIISDNKKNNKIKYNLFERYLIKNIPIKNIKLWLIGLPGNNNNFALNSLGFLKEINYIHNLNILKIKYKQYFNNINPPMPIKIEFCYNNINTIYLKICNWNINA